MKHHDYINLLCGFTVFLLTVAAPAVTFSQPVTSSAGDIPDSNHFSTVIEAVSFKNTDVRDVLRGIANKYKLNLQIDNRLQQRITVHLSHMTVREVLIHLAVSNGISITYEEGVVHMQPEIKPVEVTCDQGKLTIDLDQHDIQTVIRAIAKVCDRTILLADNARTGILTGFLNATPFENGLRQLLRINGFELIYEQDLYLVRKLSGDDPKTMDHTATLGQSVKFIDSLFSINVHHMSMEQLIRSLAKYSSTGLVMNTELRGQVSANIEKASLEEVLNRILDGTEFTYKRQGNIIVIGNRSQACMQSQKVVKLDFLKADKLVEALGRLWSDDTEIIPLIENNALMLRGMMPALSEIASYIGSIDHPTPQILIEILVVDINDTRLTELSMQSGFRSGNTQDTLRDKSISILPGIDFLLYSNRLNRFVDKAGHLLGFSKIGKLPDDFFFAVKALEQKGVVKIHSRPQLATLNGCTADIAIGTTQYYKLVTKTPLHDPTQLYISETESFKTIEASISLKITPWVSSGGEITVEIHPQFNTPIGTFSPEIPPTLQSRSLNTVVRLSNGETIVLGGLVQWSSDEISEGIPYLSRIPVLGNLLKGQSRERSKKELVIYVTPYLDHKPETINGIF